MPSIDEIMARKEGIFVAIPNIGATMSTTLAMWINHLAFVTIDQDSPYYFKVFLPNDITPIEYARNVCVHEFMKDPYFRRLWFLDSDMMPPDNAIDLLDSPAGITSGMTYIWHCEQISEKGYTPPALNINAYNYRPATNDFQSQIPPTDHKAFECDAVGMACAVIKREVFEHVSEPWYRTLRDGHGRTLRGEDLDFCKRANEHGYRVFYNPKVAFGHQKTLDLQQVLRYGISCMKNVADRVRAGDKPPVIKFGGQKDEERPKAPKTFEVMESHVGQ